MSTKPSVQISCFSDEISANFRTQLEVTQALGLGCISIRSGDPAATGRSNNIMKWSDHEITVASRMLDEFSIRVAEFGSPIGKVKLQDGADGSTNRFVERSLYLDDVRRACDLACRFGTKRIRGFSFYHPKGGNPDEFIDEAADRIGEIATICSKCGLVYGMELESNLIGDTGERLMRIIKIVNEPYLRLVADPANITCRNIPGGAVAAHKDMRSHLGWMHAKEYKMGSAAQVDHVDENFLRNFVPFGTGDSLIDEILMMLRQDIPRLEQELLILGVKDGVLITLEPHLRGGGQFGGFSGPDGMGIALRALCHNLNRYDIGYNLMQFRELKK
ncbi:hypothetical protein A3C37_03535 [Candidatus Peribacteria bacterium RIFCSPHIGHO2_02_FULL_53_20]|nr:MAG: hypothetical protein A3C37_03535 [Candidatus Peribacteria bacterium RIFCSPHIGHO2_02_FULL_53_20]OGJ67768.1 MAG: hypothetical protein A3B61_01135 [Candidatus Peribacteria bacterium RIFCSPLOWO2_01_FULL_53_10]OGJ71861.1 MAG: hypothetical protein A3G69_04650 [Candidatus Peribacteria bacterium RIFCSPLOWO2_12_FULL_53_10]